MGFVAVYLLTINLSISSIVPSAAVGFLSAIFIKKYSYEIYTGSFIGMSSAFYVNEVSDFLFISSFATFFYLLLTPHFKGIGGKFGMIAFLSVSSLIILRSFV